MCEKLGRKQNVATVLEGSIQKAGDRGWKARDAALNAMEISPNYSGIHSALGAAY